MASEEGTPTTRREALTADPAAGAKSHRMSGVFAALILTAAITRLALVSQIPSHRMSFDVDDLLYLRHATALASFDWLGDFDHRLLTKAPGYGIFIALSSLLGLGRRLGEEVLLLGAALHFALTLRRMRVNAVFAALAFAAIVLSPALLFGTLQRTIREGIYASQCLLLVSCIARFISAGRPAPRFANAVFAALLAAWTAITREEWVWLAAPVSPLIAAAAFRGGPSLGMKAVRGAFAAVVIFGAMYAGVFLVKQMNRTRYGAPVVTDLEEKNFAAATAAFQRVADIKPMRFEPLDMGHLRTLAQKCPTLAELMPAFESQSFRDPSIAAENGERQCCFTMWTLRQAAADLGWYRSATDASRAFEKLAAEMNAAMDAGVIPAGPTRSHAMPYPRREYWGVFAKKIFEHTKDVWEFKFPIVDGIHDFPVVQALRPGDERYLPVAGAVPAASPQSTMRAIKAILAIRAFQTGKTMLAVLVIGALSALAGLLRRRWNPASALFWLATALLVGFIARSAIVAYLETYYFTAATQYLMPFYSWPAVAAIIACGAVFRKPDAPEEARTRGASAVE